jgi:1-acyl-sn-glycerol-3-phosphate acyltransferase
MVHMEAIKRIRYPRRRWIRGLLHQLSHALFERVADLEIIGQENIPSRGPLLLVANHFSFLDPAVIVGELPWPLEFMGGFRMPNAPFFVTWIPQLWGYLPVFRGSPSRGALRASEQVLAQQGVLGIFPEGGSWAQELRPPRPGVAYLAARTGVKLLPVGIDGMTDLLACLRQRRRAHVVLRIGHPFGPFNAEGGGRAHRHQLDAIGDEIMFHIAALLPPERRGWYSDDPLVRAAAQASYVYPWANLAEV